MERKHYSSMSVVPLSEAECIHTRGGTGAGDWDKEVAGYIGMGVGYGVKKLWRAFQFMSANLYTLQTRVQVIQ